jgi:hypothetical protein
MTSNIAHISYAFGPIAINLFPECDEKSKVENKEFNYCKSYDLLISNSMALEDYGIQTTYNQFLTDPILKNVIFENVEFIIMPLYIVSSKNESEKFFLCNLYFVNRQLLNPRKLQATTLLEFSGNTINGRSLAEFIMGTFDPESSMLYCKEKFEEIDIPKKDECISPTKKKKRKAHFPEDESKKHSSVEVAKENTLEFDDIEFLNDWKEIINSNKDLKEPDFSAF